MEEKNGLPGDDPATMVLEEASKDTFVGASIVGSLLPVRTDLKSGEECLRASEVDEADSGVDICGMASLEGDSDGTEDLAETVTRAPDA